MIKKTNQKIILIILALLMAVSAIIFIGCGGDEPEVNTALKNFTLTVVDIEGNQTVFELSSDKKFLGDALLEEEIIKGEEGPYGLYIKEVNGISAVYEVDGTYWAFYIGSEYAMTGVDATEITDGASYTLKVEK